MSKRSPLLSVETTTRSSPSAYPAALAEPEAAAASVITEAADEASPDEELDPTRPHSIETLSESQGVSTEAEVVALANEGRTADSVRIGRLMGNRRCSDETFRVVSFALDAWRCASPSQRRTLGLHPRVFAVAAWAGAESSRLARRLAARSSRRLADNRATKARSQQHFAAARASADQLRGALNLVYANDRPALLRVKSAAHPPSPRAQRGPGRSLASLVTLAQEALDGVDAGLLLRCSMWGVTRAGLAEASLIAEAALDAQDAQDTPAESAQAMQATVDRWEGLTCMIMRGVVRAFERARLIDASIPSIGYLFLRSVLAPKRTKKPQALKAAEGGATTAAANAVEKSPKAAKAAKSAKSSRATKAAEPEASKALDPTGESKALTSASPTPSAPAAIAPTA